MVFWFAYSFYLDGTLGVLVAVIGVFSNGMSFVYGMVYLLAPTGALIVIHYDHLELSKSK